MAGFFGWMPPTWRAQVRNNIDIADTHLDMSTHLDPRDALRTKVTANRDIMGTTSRLDLSADEATSKFEASARAERHLNDDTLIHADGTLDNQGGRRWSTGLAHAGNLGSGNLNLRGDANVVSANADANFNHLGHAVSLRGDINSEGDWHGGFTGSHDWGDSTRITENVRLGRGGRLSVEADAERTINDSTSIRFGGSHDEHSNSIHGGGRFSVGGLSTDIDASWSHGAGFHGTGGLSTDIGGIGLSGTAKRGAGDNGLTGKVSTNIAGVGLSGTVTYDDGETGLSTGGSTHLSNIFGTNLNLNGSVDGGLVFKSGKPVMLGSDKGSQLRRNTLRIEPLDAKFVEYGMRATAAVDTALSLPLGVGSVTTGMSAGRSYELTFVRLGRGADFATTPKSANWDVPKTASQALGMLAGESFKITGDMSHGVRGGGSVSSGHGVARASADACANVILSGDTNTEVFRKNNKSVRLVTKVTRSNSFENELKIKLSAGFGTAFGGDNVIAKGVTRAAQGALEDWLGAGIRHGWERSKKDDRLMDAQLDLSFTVVGQAYERALAGDWTNLRDLAKSGHPGVVMNRFVFTAVQEKTQSVSQYAFGNRHGELVTETIGHSDVFSEGAYFGVTTELDTSSSETADWFKKHTYDVKDFSRHIRPGAGASLGALKSQDHWLEWSHEAQEDFTSKDALLRGLGVARFLMRGTTLEALKLYESKVKGVSPRTRMFLGPRNELAKTTLKIDVKVDDAGLDKICGRSEKHYWNAYAQAWRSIYPDRNLPVWADPIRRRALSTHGPMSDNTADFAELYRVEQLIERLQSAPQKATEERNDWLRDSLYENRADEAWMAALALLAGREHIQVKVAVDSSEGTDGSPFDMNLEYRGDDFEIQDDVFGI